MEEVQSRATEVTALLGRRGKAKNECPAFTYSQLSIMVCNIGDPGKAQGSPVPKSRCQAKARVEFPFSH